MRTKSWILVLIFSLSINAAVLGICGYHYYRYACVEPSAYCPLSPGDGHLYESLGLSDPQLARMGPLARAFHHGLERLGRDMAGKRDALVELLSQEGADPESIERLRREVAEIQDRIQREVMAHIFDVKEILNTEQEKRFFELLRKSIREDNWFSEKRGHS